MRGGERDLGPADLAGPLFEAEAARLAEARAHACEAWAEAELELGRHALLAPELTRTWTSWYDIITMSSSF